MSSKPVKTCHCLLHKISIWFPRKIPNRSPVKTAVRVVTWVSVLALVQEGMALPFLRGSMPVRGMKKAMPSPTLDAGHKLTLNSGQDTTLKGAQVSGEQVTPSMSVATSSYKVSKTVTAMMPNSKKSASVAVTR